MERLAWQSSVSEGFIWDMSANLGKVAVIDPKFYSLVILSGETGIRESVLLGEWFPTSVTLTSNLDLIVSRELQVGKTNLLPALGICPLEDGLKAPTYLLSGDFPRYNHQLWLGQAIQLPNQNQAVIGGISDRDDVQGFLLLASWDSQIGQGEFSPILSEIYEGPADIAIKDDLVYFATGRGGTVGVYDLNEKKALKNTTFLSAEYKPSQLSFTENFLVSASYNELFWFKYGDDIFLSGGGNHELTERTDCINGIASLPEDNLLCALTYTNRLVRFSILTGNIADIDLGQTLEAPCFVVADPQIINRYYISGHKNGKIWAVDL